MPKTKLANIMQSEGFIALSQYMEVGDAMKHWRKVVKPRKMSDFVYVLGDGNELLGAVSVKELFLEDPKKALAKVMDAEFPSVYEKDTVSRAVGIAIESPVSEIPVVDKEKRLVGVVSTNDLLDALDWIHTRNLHRLAGILREHESIALKPSEILKAVKSRLPWLAFAVVVGVFVAGNIIRHYEASIITIPSVAVFIPVVMGFGGNIGGQTSAILVSMLSKKDPAVMREMKSIFALNLLTGIALGVIMGALTGGSAIFLFGQAQLGWVLFYSMLIISIFGIIIGFLIPFTSYKLRLDPALVSGPLVTSVKDATALLIYFFVIQLLL